MRDRSEQILRIACLTLAALVLLQLVRAGFQVSQLAGAKIPGVPTLEPNTNTTAGLASKAKMATANLPDATAKIKNSVSTNSAAAQRAGETNSVSTNAVMQTAGGTNSISTNSETAQIARGTNSTSTNSEAAKTTVGTNSISTNSEAAQMTGGTNSASTNSEAAQIPDGTNSVPTNSEVAQNAGGTNPAQTNLDGAPIAGATNSISTNSVAQFAGGTNSISTNSEVERIVGGTNSISTNVVAHAATNANLTTKTNLAAAGATNASGRHLPPSLAGTPGMPGGAPKLSPEIQARVDKIVNSEIFAPVMHPLPMGLLGIAGDTAFLRTAGGQTGLVKPGDALGDLKLLQIGINRVLVEQDGQKKELTIFNGFGSGSLLTNQDDTTNENIQLQKRAGPPGAN